MGKIADQSRVGFYYYPDTTHYRETDLNTWLPRLKHLGAKWITLAAHSQRAIPEFFLRGLMDQGIIPIIHLHQNLTQQTELRSQRVLFEAYAQWGVRYIALFDRPNRRLSWEPALWAQPNLVERYMDIFLPLAETVLHAGLTPILSPLEPGGDYWDTMFLKTALNALLRREKESLIKKFALGVYAWTFQHPLHWGAGGPEQWRNTRPYFTSEDSQDQIGFHIYDWYLATARAVLGFAPPIFLLGAGCRFVDCMQAKIPMEEHKRRNIEILGYVRNDPQPSPAVQMDPLPGEVKAVNFWLLGADQEHPESKNAWFPVSQRPLAIAEAFMSQNPPAREDSNLDKGFRPGKMGHYLLIPEYSWRNKDHVYQAVPNLTEQKSIMAGYSTEEALKAQRVTIIGDEKWLDESCFTHLTEAGCLVEEIYGDGIYLASKLSNLTY